MSTVHARALQRAAQILGGTAELRAHLRVPLRSLEAWLSGTEQPPVDVFLRAVDVISTPPAAADAVQQSRQLRRTAEELRAASTLQVERAKRMREAILGARPPERAATKARSALAFLQARFEPSEGAAMVSHALDAAMRATGADLGNIQLVCADGLRIVVQRGFDAPFLSFFECVNDAGCACGAAMENGSRIVVPDVATDAVFAGTPALEVMLDARALAVQSTPLASASGLLLGMVSTHYDRPHRPDERELDVIDHIARRAAFWLDGGMLTAITPGR